MEADEIEKLTKDEVIEFFNKYVARGGSSLKQLNVKIESKSKPGEKATGVKADYTIEDISAFKSSHPYIERPISKPKL